jgi:hypothetical protein
MMAVLAGAPVLPLKLAVTYPTSSVAIPAAAVTVDIYTIDAGQDGGPDQPATGTGAGGNGGACNFQTGILLSSLRLVGSTLYCTVGNPTNVSSAVFNDPSYRSSSQLVLSNTLNGGGGGGGFRNQGPIGGGGGACGTEQGAGGSGDNLGNPGIPVTAGSVLAPYVGPGGASAASGIGWGAGGGGGNATGNLAGGAGNPGGILFIFR